MRVKPTTTAARIDQPAGHAALGHDGARQHEERMVSIETLPTPLANCCMTAPTGKSIQSAPTSEDSASA